MGEKIFQGEYEMVVDAAGRIHIPFNFITRLDKNFRCSLLTEDPLMKCLLISRRRRGRFDFQLDRRGRFLIPPKARLATGLERGSRAIVRGLDDTIEICSLEKWRRFEEEFDRHGAEMMNRLAR